MAGLSSSSIDLVISLHKADPTTHASVSLKSFIVSAVIPKPIIHFLSGDIFLIKLNLFLISSELTYNF